MIHQRLLFSFLVLFATSFLLPPNIADAATAHHWYRAIPSTAEGTGAFFPPGTPLPPGYFFGPGSSPELGDSIYCGTLVLEQTDEFGLSFDFENAGRGTDDEIFHEVIYTDGSTISTRFEGSVDLEVLEVDDQGNPVLVTAEWTGIWTVVKGTGQFRGAKGQFEVTAINEPFNPATEPIWRFSWTWEGTIFVPKYRFFKTGCLALRLTTQGEGVFDPANLGLDPNYPGPPSLPQPIVIGDGSGEGIYNGTPTGNDFRINGKLIGNGFDQHFGTAQSISPGVLFPNLGLVRYPGETGVNPRDGDDRKLHVMKTLIGQIWFEYKYYFELDPTAGKDGLGQITGRADFRIVGGTWFFKHARGSVFVLVVSDLADLGPGPSAPFHYDFTGYLEYCFFGHKR
ncbi:MAG: hypothetical protein ACR2NP_06315 [Pirellulaceae bacterium]